MNTSPAHHAPTTTSADAAASAVHIPQYSRGKIVAVWVAAAVPMAALAWLAAPLLADRLSPTGPVAMAKALLVCLTAGLVWQFVLVVALIWHEQKTLRWPVVREALWLHRPRSARSGRTGGRVWLAVLPMVGALALEETIPQVAHPGSRDL